MLNFPDAPSVGTLFQSGGSQWRWTGVKWAPSTTTPTGGIGRSFIHNGQFNIQQRGTSLFTVAGTYTADRWQLSRSATDTLQIQPQSASDADRAAIGDEAARNKLYVNFTGSAVAGNYSIVVQNIEDVMRLAGKTVTVSFWAMSTIAFPKIGVSLDQFFGSGGSPSATVENAGQSVTLTSSWARYSLTFAVPSASGKTRGTNNDDKTQLLLWVSASSTFAVRSGNIGAQSSNVYLWGVQLEIGSVVTVLEKPDPRYDLANCQRFYQVGYSSYSSSGAAGWGYGWSMPFPVPMRATPTMVMGTPNYTGATAASLSANSAATYLAVAQSTGTGNWVASFTWTASADL